MDDFLLRIYVLEVETQCDFALLAADQFMLSLQRLDQDSFWPAVQSFLVATANVSKLLWPGRNKEIKRSQYAKARGQELRQLLGITDASPLHSRKLRDHFEHFDERIDTWALESHSHVFADRNIAPRRMIQGVAPEDYMRNFDPETHTVNFREEEFELLPLLAAVGQIKLQISGSSFGN